MKAVDLCCIYTCLTLYMLLAHVYIATWGFICIHGRCKRGYPYLNAAQVSQQDIDYVEGQLRLQHHSCILNNHDHNVRSADKRY